MGQLKNIIRKRHLTILRESVMDMQAMEGSIGSAPETVAGMFGELMRQLFWEEPEAFEGRTTEAEWESQVYLAEQQLVDAIVMAIEDEVKNTESMLHDGQFMTGPR